LNKKLAANDKVLENLNSTIESFTSAMKNQLSFNKMIETQLAQLAASLPSFESCGIPGQPEPTREHVSAISTGWGKPSRRAYAPNHVGKPIHQIQFRIGWRNMTFKFQVNEDQCYLVQDEEARRWREPRPQHKKDEVSPTKPKVKSFNAPPTQEVKGNQQG
jgi:hypothetical protein